MLKSISELGSGLPGLMQATIQARRVGMLFDGMSDEAVLRAQVVLDRNFAARYESIGQHETASMYSRRAEAIDNLLKKVGNEKVPDVKRDDAEAEGADRGEAP